jgi:hypothetical protein
MSLLARSPTGKTFRVSNTRNGVTRIRLYSVSDASGQWLFYSESGAPRVIAGVCRGRRLETAGVAYIATISLNEAGVEMVALITSSGLRVWQIEFSPSKLPLPRYHEFVDAYQNLFGPAAPGAASLDAQRPGQGATARSPTNDEAGLAALMTAGELLPSAEALRRELHLHDRGNAGSAAVSAQATLIAWRANHGWYRASNREDFGAIAVGNSRFVVPLRAMPRTAEGGNLVVAALIHQLQRVMRLLPSGAEGALAYSLVGNAISRLRVLDILDTSMDDARARAILGRQDLPPHASHLAAIARDLEDQASKLKLAPSLGGANRIGTPDATRVFQEVAVSSVLLGLGCPLDLLRKSKEQLRVREGLVFNGIRAWADTPDHGSQGWRDDLDLPSRYRPDLLMHREADGAVLLADAKLRAGESDLGLLSASGVKDLQAYMQEYGLSKAVMLVPSKEGTIYRQEEVRSGDFAIRAIAIPPEPSVKTCSGLIGALNEMWNAQTAKPFKAGGKARANRR